ncbi:MAG: YidC/Oxa1 family membrane protein insertase [Psychromonas sp.]|jgi:YidC/Oxa1 family membrane protein insertase
MDKNTVAGLVLIGVILSVFTIFNQPSEEDLLKVENAKIEQSKIDSLNLVTLDSLNALKDDASITTATDASSQDSNSIAATVEKKAETVRIENERVIVEFSSIGGQVSAVFLKEFETYYEFSKKDDKQKALRLFLDGDASNGLILRDEGKLIRTSDLAFTIEKKDKNRVVFRHKPASGKAITFDYSLKKDAYEMTYNLELKGLKEAILSEGVQLAWNTSFRKTERLFSEQRRVSTVCYSYSNEGFDYLSEVSDDDEIAEDEIDWVAYKQSFFSSILKPNLPFKKNSTLEVHTYKDNEKKINTHLKDYKSKLVLDMPASNESTAQFSWFFGPNDYEVLASFDAGYDDILNFGWGIFRWINLYAVQPLFNFLLEQGIGIGIAILLLTLVLKLVLTPIQWKMYVSSAKMRIMKPQIDELNAKFPDKSDAMKKQSEMMSLYKDSGASPLSGCIPMLIQMPILLAVFRFFPSAFELRQKGFLWAEDLSSYDSIFDIGFYIWPYGDHVSLFTLLMAATTLVYTHINSGNMQQPSQPGMPNMKVIMYIFPFMMIFFFNNYSSGLSYYYFISTLMSILIMVTIKKYFVDEDKLKAKMAARKVASSEKKGSKKKSKFQERLETMQKAQQEKMKKK